MTEKPSRNAAGGRYTRMPYCLVYAATWGATILSYFPKWFTDAIFWVMQYVVKCIREVMD